MLQASRDRRASVAGGVELLLDAAEQEDLVVHREAKGEREDQDGLSAVEAVVGLEAQQL